MTFKDNLNNNIKLQNIIQSRVPPFVWDIIGYCGGLFVIIYYNKNFLIGYSCFFILYGLLNIIFDFFSVSFEFSNISMPNFKNICEYNFYITNKKYILQSKSSSSNPFEHGTTIDDSRIKIDISIYVGDYVCIKYFLMVIYLLGITKQNYTIMNYNDFKDKFYFLV